MSTRAAEKIAKDMVAEGHSMEAAEYAKVVAHVLPEAEVRALLHVLADAILSPVPRKRGDKFVNRSTFEKLAEEVATVGKVRKSGKKVTAAFDFVGQDERNSTSPGTVKRRYYKHSR